MFKSLLHRNFYKQEVILLLIGYLSLIISFIFGENSTGGALIDYSNQKNISQSFSNNFTETLLNYDNFSSRHSPSLIIILSFFEKINLPDSLIRIIHLHYCILLPFFFYKCLKLKYKDVDYRLYFFLVLLIFLSPTFRTLAIWPDSRISGLIFFTVGIFFYYKFLNDKKFYYVFLNIFFISISAYFSPNFSVFSIFFFLKFILIYNYEIKKIFLISCINLIFAFPALYYIFLNIFFIAISAYFSPNFSVFSLFFFLKFILIYNYEIKKIFLISCINLIFAFPALYYIFFLDINFLAKSAAIGFDTNEKLIFHNIFNDILITFSMLFFYLTPFIFSKIIILPKYFTIKNLLITLIIFFISIINFDYNIFYSGGGIFLKLSNFIFQNNYLFYLICLASLLLVLPLIYTKKLNILLLFLILLNNPQYTMYHKYFDPFLLIIFFTIFSLKINFEKFKLSKNSLFVFFYFFTFLIISNFKYLWKI